MRPLFVLALVGALALAGCARPGESSENDNVTTPTSTTPATTTPSASHNVTGRFVVANLTILAPDGEARQLYEGDRNATVRFVIENPGQASDEEFVSYVVDGRVVDVQQVKLAGGANKTFERKLQDLAVGKSTRIDVRAGAGSKSATVTVNEWPRTDGTLTLGPMKIRTDHGLQQLGGRVLVNLSLENVGGMNATNYRVKMLCADAAGNVQPMTSVPFEAPTAGNATGVDVQLDDCQTTRYGLEFKADGEETEHWGRILLVPRGWSGTAA